MVVNNISSQTSSPANNYWLSDSGCNACMTNDLANLNISNDYNREESIIVGNGQPLNITHNGSGILPTPSNTFHLSNIYPAPKLTSNLLFVNKFWLDNNCIFVFFSDWFFIQDKVSHLPIYIGKSINGIYPIPTISTISSFPLY